MLARSEQHKVSPFTHFSILYLVSDLGRRPGAIYTSAPSYLAVKEKRIENLNSIFSTNQLTRKGNEAVLYRGRHQVIYLFVLQSNAQKHINNQSLLHLPFSELSLVQFLAQGSLGRHNIAHFYQGNYLVSLAKKIQWEIFLNPAFQSADLELRNLPVSAAYTHCK